MEHHKNVYLCFMDYLKAFDSVERSKTWNSMRSIRITEHLIVLKRYLYREQEVKMQVEQSITEGFAIQIGEKQAVIYLLISLIYTAHAL